LTVTHLVVFPQGPLYRGDQGLRGKAVHAKQIDALRPYFSRLTVCARVEEFIGGDHRLQGVEVAELPPYRARTGFLARAPEYRRLMRAALRDADLALVVLPGYLGSLASWICGRDGVPRVHFVVGRWGRVVLSRRPRGPGRLKARLVGPLLDALVAHLTHDSLTFFNSALSPGAPAHHHVRISTTISLSDCLDPPAAVTHHGDLRLLFVGRLSAEKGLPFLLRAVAQLRASGVPASLELIGEGEQRGSLEREAEGLGIGEVVRFSGWLTHGAALWERFDRADVFVLPSLEDMAPRVLLEAMARRIPVVATAVGHIPHLVRDGETGLLIEPGTAQAIAAAAQRLHDEPQLRADLATRGAVLAAEHTLTAETARTIAIIRDHFADGSVRGV
jgi:glycosyltransferase involved in cell wall biosynthesis